MPIFHPDTVYLRLDVHNDSISVAILNPGHESPGCEKIFHDEPSVRRLIGHLPQPRLVRGVMRRFALKWGP